MVLEEPNPDSEPESCYATIAEAGRAIPGGSASAKAKLIATYRPFIIGVVANFLLAKTEIEDVAHDFILNEMINGKVISKFDGVRRFRPYLRTCVRNYCIDYLRKKRRNDEQQRFTPEKADLSGSTADEADAIWARTVFANTLVNMKQECIEKDQVDSIWTIFQNEVLHPLFHGTAKKGNDYYGLNARTYGHRLETAYRKLRRFLNEEIAELKSVESHQSLFRIIGELLKVPLANEPMVQQLLSKSFRDDDISEIFLSDGFSGGLAGLYPAIDIDDKPLRSRWLGLLQTTVAELLSEQDVEPDFMTVDDVVFQDGVSLKTRLLIQQEAKRQTDSCNDFPHVYFALYVLLICRQLAEGKTRTTTLLTNQLTHNIFTCKKFEWLGDDARELLDRALAVIDED